MSANQSKKSKKNKSAVEQVIQKEEEYQSKKTAKAPVIKKAQKQVIPEWYVQDAKTEESAAYEKKDAAMQVEEDEEVNQLISEIKELCQ